MTFSGTNNEPQVPMRFLSTATMVVVMLNFSNSYTFISGSTGIPFRIVGLVFVGLLGIYLLRNLPQAHSIMAVPRVRWYILLFVVLPTVSAVIAPMFFLRYVGYVVLHALIFLAVAVWIKEEGWRRFGWAVFASWVVSIVGIVASYYFPDIFRGVAELEAEAAGGAGAWERVRVSTEHLGRAFGFYMQPNRASWAIVVHLLILCPTLLGNKPLRRYLVVGISFGAVLLTGSRGGALLFAVLACAFVLNEMLLGVRTERYGRRSAGSLIAAYALAAGIAGCAFLAIETYAVRDEPGESTVGRITNLVTGDSEDLSADSSIQARLYAQSAYLSEIKNSPIWGYGLGANTYYQHVGRLPLSSHNSVIENVYLYGVPVGIGMYILLFSTCLSRESKRLRRIFFYDVSWLVFGTVLVGSMVSNSVIDFRVFPALAAWWFVMVYFPTSCGGNESEVRASRRHLERRRPVLWSGAEPRVGALGGQRR